MTHPPVSLARLPDWTQTLPYTIAHTYWRHTHAILGFYSWKRLNPNFLRKLKRYDRVNIICFWKGQVQPESVTSSKHSSDVIKVLSSSKPKTSGTVGFFSKNRFQINRICVEQKYTLQIIALFLNWKQPSYRLKCLKYSIYIRKTIYIRKGRGTPKTLINKETEVTST